MIKWLDLSDDYFFWKDVTLQITESCETNKDIILEDNKIRKIIHNSDVYVLKLICDFIDLMGYQFDV